MVARRGVFGPGSVILCAKSFTIGYAVVAYTTDMMENAMPQLIGGLALFFGLHSLPIVQTLRSKLHDMAGDIPYRIIFSVLSLAGLILISNGYTAWKYEAPGSPILWVSPTWLVHIALLLNLFAFVSIAATYGKSHIKKAVKHPMILSVKIWAFAHLLSNGDLASLVLFGAFLAWGVVDRISVKKRERAGLIAPTAFEPRWRDDAIAVTVGVTVYVLFVWKLHLWLMGVSPVAM